MHAVLQVWRSEDSLGCHVKECYDMSRTFYFQSLYRHLDFKSWSESVLISSCLLDPTRGAWEEDLFEKFFPSTWPVGMCAAYLLDG